MQKFLVLVFTESWLPYMCGVTEAVMNMVISLRHLGQIVFIITPDHPRKDQDLDREYNVIRIPSYTLKGARDCYFTQFYNWWAMEKIIDQIVLTIDRQLVKNHIASTDIVIHTNGPYGSHWLALKLARRLKKERKINPPIFMTWHTLIEDYLKIWFPNLLMKPLIGLLKRFIITPLCNRCDLILAPTEFIKDLLKSYRVKTNIQVVSLPIALPNLKIRFSEIDELRKKFRINKEAKILLYVGRICPEKNIKVLLQSFKLILSSIPNCHLILVGGGQINQYQKYANEIGILPEKITFTGEINRDHIFPYYFLADLFLFASITDNTPRVILEVMACGLPIVAVRAGGIPELVKDYDQVVLVDNNQEIVGNLAIQSIRMLKELLIKSKEKFQLVEQKSLSEKYNPEFFAQKLIQIYQNFRKLAK